MNFCIAKKHKLSKRPQSATPKLRRVIKTTTQEKVESFCSYFFAEDKECQTFAPIKYKSVCKKLLKSHRNSIEQEVISIFQNSNNANLVDLEPERKIIERKGDNLKDLIRNARYSLERKQSKQISSPICVSKVRIGKKSRVSPCNKDFCRLGKLSVFILATPTSRRQKKFSRPWNRENLADGEKSECTVRKVRIKEEEKLEKCL